ncbi:MAG TPA: hypothetical protein VGR73_19725 [Bryobacteraceae bacterium]|nr:hypothetical protein [Bryobacteraceae bacterium]
MKIFLPVIALASFITPLTAQWAQYRTPGIPRTADGKPDLTAPAPRLNRKPDLAGLWQTAPPISGDAFGIQSDASDIGDIHRNVFYEIKREEEPLKPAASALVAKRRDAPRPQALCLPMGAPSFMMVRAFKIIQTPQELVMIGETPDPPRQIYLDGRALPKDPDPTWLGSSVGKWDGDTLVVQTTGFKEQGWLDNAGHPRGESMLITERYRRRDFGHIDLEIRYEDAKYYTRPFANKITLHLLPDSDVIEYVCTENEKDKEHSDKP